MASQMALFNTAVQDFDYSWTAALSDTLTGVKVVPDTPPKTKGSASIFIECAATASSFVITPKVQLYFYDNVGTDGYGSLHSITDVDGNTLTITTSVSAAVKFEANLYEQTWWKANNGFRVVLTRASNVAVDPIDGVAVFE